MLTVLTYYIDCKFNKNADDIYIITCVFDLLDIIIVIGIIDGIFK